MGSSVGNFISDPIGSVLKTTADVVTLGGYSSMREGRKAQKAAQAEAAKQKKEQDGLLAKQKQDEETAKKQESAIQTNQARLASFRRRQRSRKSGGVLGDTQTTLGSSTGTKNLLGA